MRGTTFFSPLPRHGNIIQRLLRSDRRCRSSCPSDGTGIGLRRHGSEYYHGRFWYRNHIGGKNGWSYVEIAFFAISGLTLFKGAAVKLGLLPNRGVL